MWLVNLKFNIVFLDNWPENYSSTGMFSQRHAIIFMDTRSHFSFLPIILSSFSYLLFQLFWNIIIMHLIMPRHGFTIAGSHPLNLQGLCLPPPENLGCFQCKGIQLQHWVNCLHWLFLIKNTPTEASIADPLEQNKNSSSINFLRKSTYYSFCPEILAYYSRKVLNSFSYLLFSKLCKDNPSRPTK